jgi:hypothetical protein
MLGIPVNLSKITLSQIIADNKIGGTSVILDCLAFCVNLQLNIPFSQVINLEKCENYRSKKQGRAL